MKILVLTGSPRMGGNSQALAAAFVDGARQAGHQVLECNLSKMRIGPCLACDHCRREATLGRCVQQDDMRQLYDIWFEQDAVVWASPLYYFGLSAQTKLALDRLYALPNQKKPNNKLRKMALLIACADTEAFAADGVIAQFHIICDYFGLPSGGEVVAQGVAAKGAIKDHPALKRARQLGLDF